MEFATWEDKQESQAKSPVAPAWGQAGDKEEENVTSLKEPEPDEAKAANEDTSLVEVGDEDGPAAHLKPGRSKRGAVPSTRYAGPDWMK
jgi:hypothetical protein